jgi:hypothetical protein
MSEGTVRQWCRIFKEGRTDLFTMMSEVVGRLSVMGDDFFKVLTKIVVKVGASQFQNVCANFHKIDELFSMRLSQLG